ncbi:MAG: hypothetical protein KME13_18465 [Myxacorys californica WJT36-NPBG1]|jgi:hypothetical protein|nr:hypothetical protein [Myxacorys californica WJT36-NPBG1]
MKLSPLINPQSTAKLSSANQSTGHYARLVDAKNQRVFEFQYNPESKEFSRKANYGAAPTAATSTPSQNYLFTEGKTLRLSNLLLDSFCLKKSLRPILNDLEALLVINEKSFSPTPVYFVWGTEKFGPCVVTDIDWTETAWLAGEPAKVILNVSLLRVPDPDSVPKQTSIPKNLTSPKLSQRQKVDGSKKAKEFLVSNVAKFSPNIKKAIQTNSYKLSTSDSGSIKVLNSKGEELGIIGTYNALTSKLDTSKTTIK